MECSYLRIKGVNYGTYPVYLKGSRHYIKRCVYGLDNAYYIIWGKQCVEVVRSHSDYITVGLF